MNKCNGATIAITSDGTPRIAAGIRKKVKR
jgi:hypothetical protein